ncbi:4-alpha-glucanotransferase [Egibacter rhizosphaerae]|uniref:4-alpha-glucanotransferase n=1 Tax=Egibacter rhizosphaerae TaxID=1670831 RepID=A0A411YFI9_9ACTN|nr:4-alpha-glucanotransferase [Egibacter rhizosphaerae]QBI20024.1 4-alpha-glucanotransferase [Egibacter rhizosphaerae]
MGDTGRQPAGTNPELGRLAHAHGVATAYRDSDERERPVPEDTVRAALRVLGVPCEDQTSIRAALTQANEAPWRRSAPATHVVTGDRPVPVPLALDDDARLTADLTGPGGRRRLAEAAGPDQWGQAATATIDGRRHRAGALALPTDLPLGDHALTLEIAGREGTVTHHSTLVVTPPRAPRPDDVGLGWGWMVQLYALRSESSWGHGDLADLAALARWTGGAGGDFVVVNPLHAANPSVPVEESPYYPSSRRFANPMYLRVDALPEFELLDAADRERVVALARRARRDNTADRIERDAVHARQQAALERLFAAGRSPGREQALASFVAREGRDLTDFATFCAIAERYGTPFSQWPAELRHPHRAEVAAFRAAHAERVRYHQWLQLCCDEQLADSQRAAVDAGLGLGIVHDLAVGVDKGGADAWALQDELGLGVTVGAPPDAFNQQGQDWQQPPLLPNRLPESGYAPFRSMLRAVLRHAGGIRVDHILGLFRLFWIPEGADAADGTYVDYPSDEMLGILALEAHEAGAVLVGEDLGTVPEGVRDALADRHVLSSSVLYFERDDEGELRSADDYPREALASVTTHDLPSAAGWWELADVDLRDELGLHGEGHDPVDARAARQAERDEMAQLLVDDLERVGDVPNEPPGLPAEVQQQVLAMHAFLGRSPARLVAASLHDAVGDLRQPNLPGTVDDYPNWRRPIAAPEPGGARPITLDELTSHPFASRLIETVAAARRQAAEAGQRP